MARGARKRGKMLDPNEILLLGEQCESELNRCWEIAREKWGIDFSDTILIWSKRTTCTAGRAWYKERAIQLSRNLLLLNRDMFVQETPGHEAAHIIAFGVFGARGHGKAWKYVMGILEVNGKRCHSMKVTI